MLILKSPVEPGKELYFWWQNSSSAKDSMIFSDCHHGSCLKLKCNQLSEKIGFFWPKYLSAQLHNNFNQNMYVLTTFLKFKKEVVEVICLQFCGKLNN